MNQNNSRVEEILANKLHALETDWSDGCYIRGEDVDAICDYIHQELQKAREELLDAVCGVLPKRKPVIVNMLQEDSLFIRHGIDGVIGYNEALKDAKTPINNLLDDNK
jgi:hypothetical protein